MSVEITAAAMRKLAENIENDSDPSLFKAMKALRQAADALEASQARIAAYECLQQSTQTRVRELEDDNSALKLSLASGGGRLSSGAKIWLQQKERAEQAEARVAARELQISSLFARIEHGDETHRAWLKSALGLHFAEGGG